MPAISLKRHRSPEGVVVAACDEELLGRLFVEGKARLEVHRAFYDGERVDEETLVRLLAVAPMANLTGERTVRACIAAGFATEQIILRIDGIPHVQLLQM